MHISTVRPVRHDYLVNPANVGDAMALMMQHAEALAPAERLKHTSAWLHEGCAFASVLYRNADAGCTLRMLSDHPDFEDETFELDDSQAAEWIGEQRPKVCRLTPAEMRLASFSTTELAARWRCRRDTVDYMVEGGHLGAFRDGRFRRIRRAEVEKFERAHNMRGLLRLSVDEASDMNRTLNMIAVRLRAERKAARATA